LHFNSTSAVADGKPGVRYADFPLSTVR
jgi:hypothetical protein